MKLQQFTVKKSDYMFLTANASTISPIIEEPHVKPEQTTQERDQVLREKSREFEAVFIGQMLKFSGFDKALTLGGGSDASAFTGMYIQQFAEKIADNGGFGLAEKIYDQMSRLNQETNKTSNEGADNVFPDKV